MSISFFKSKRINGDSKSSSKPGTDDSNSKSQKKSSSTGATKSGVAMPVGAPVGAAAPNCKPRRGERSLSVDATAWADAECPIDSRIMSSTVSDKSLSISRSGRYKAKLKTRTPLFSDESADGAADNPEANRRGATTLSSPEDRQTVLQAMAMRSGSGSASSKWSATPNSLDL